MCFIKYIAFFFFLTSTCWGNTVNIYKDARVNFKDYTIVANSWLTSQGDPNFNPKADFADPNGFIDTNDLYIIVSNWLAEPNIVLQIYSDGFGTLLKTVETNHEGSITVIVTDERPYYNPPWYFAYASRPGYYTEIYCAKSLALPLPNQYRVTFNVDLDETDPNLFNGTIFMTQIFFAARTLCNTDVNVLDTNSQFIKSFRTNEQGCFTTDINSGSYWLEFNDIKDTPHYHRHLVSITNNYQDFKFRANAQAMKPNIYLYPEDTTDILVQIKFPQSGLITDSVPAYDDGWDITVEPSGLINGQYEYLFYESFQPDEGQYTNGWVINQNELEDFFRENMSSTGFNVKEINDFIDYWIPLLTEHQYYAIYPQYNEQLDSMMKLEFSQQPDNLIRLIYAIRGLDRDYILPEPTIPPFNRDGFTVTEWGVMLK